MLRHLLRFDELFPRKLTRQLILVLIIEYELENKDHKQYHTTNSNQYKECLHGGLRDGLGLDIRFLAIILTAFYL